MKEFMVNIRSRLPSTVWDDALTAGITMAVLILLVRAASLVSPWLPVVAWLATSHVLLYFRNRLSFGKPNPLEELRVSSWLAIVLGPAAALFLAFDWLIGAIGDLINV